MSSGLADIAELVHEDRLESLTSTDCTVDFWLTWSLHLSHRQVNRTATELLLATTRFSARDVPLLRGNIVPASHDYDGSLAGLTDAQIRWLVDVEPSRRDEWTLARRFSDNERRQRREITLATEHRNSLLRPWRSIP
ncbi:MAG: hypothetical protein NVSMB60_13080 [Mycobacterium sp.]